MTTWYALRTAPQKEFALAGRDIDGKWVPGLLERKGYKTYLPIETKTKRTRKSKRRQVSYPMLRGYVFVAFEDHSIEIFNLLNERLVIDIVRDLSTGYPAQISQAQMDRLKAMSGTLVPHHRSVNTHKALRVGDMAEIVTGPYQGQLVKVVGLHGQKAKIFRNLFGSEMLVGIDIDQLEAA